MVKTRLLSNIVTLCTLLDCEWLQRPLEQEQAARTALRLDLLRCLAAAGRAADAIALYGSLLSEGAVREDDAGSRLSYATALQQVGKRTAWCQ